jgi:hypothetical protein
VFICDDAGAETDAASLTQEDEISFKEGDRIVVVGESEDDGW